MRISDWSSDVCSSDLAFAAAADRGGVSDLYVCGRAIPVDHGGRAGRTIAYAGAWAAGRAVAGVRAPCRRAACAGAALQRAGSVRGGDDPLAARAAMVQDVLSGLVCGGRAGGWPARCAERAGKEFRSDEHTSAPPSL